MKKVLAALFISLIFCSAVFAENGPKTFDEAIEKFFKDRELDPIEGIWHDEKTGYYAIVKAHKNTLDGKKIIYYESWTIKHIEPLFEGGKDEDMKYELSSDYGTFSLYKCTTTVYNPNKPSLQAKAKGRCRLESNNLILKRSFDAGRVEGIGSWKPFSSVYKQHWPNNLATIKRNEKIRTVLVIIFAITIFIVWLRWTRKNNLNEYNKKHKTNFKTYESLREFLDKKEREKSRREWKAESKRIAIEEKKYEQQKLKEEKQKLKEERSKAREEKAIISEPSSSGLTSKIARLQKLYKSGTLTKAEFEKAKNNLLK